MLLGMLVLTLTYMHHLSLQKLRLKLPFYKISNMDRKSEFKPVISTQRTSSTQSFPHPHKVTFKAVFLVCYLCTVLQKCNTQSSQSFLQSKSKAATATITPYFITRGFGFLLVWLVFGWVLFCLVGVFFFRKSTKYFDLGEKKLIYSESLLSSHTVITHHHILTHPAYTQQFPVLLT